MPTARSDSPGATAGTNSANQALGRLGSAEGILGNAYNPLTSNAARMVTVDGSQSFNAQIQCPSSQAFVTVLLTPAGGGEAGITVGEDLDFDGTVDFTYSSPVNASGVCANGIISCEPGTWNSCKGFRWTANPAGQTGLQEASITDLGGCYCINNSCGSNLLLARTGQILDTVGGGVIGSIQGLSPRYTVTRARIDGTSIFYHGQATAGCSAAGAGGSLPTAYYSQGTDTTPGLLLAGAGALEASAQAADPNSYYNLILSSYSLASNPSTTASCVVERVGSAVTNSYKFDQAGTSGILCTDNFVFPGSTRLMQPAMNSSFTIRAPVLSPTGTVRSPCRGRPLSAAAECIPCGPFRSPWSAPIPAYHRVILHAEHRRLGMSERSGES